MARKKKNRKKQMPPLSWADKVVYWVAMILSFCGIWVILPVLLLQRHIAFQDNTVIASSEGPGVLFVIPLTIWFVAVFACVYEAYKKRTPLFGIKGFRYGPPQWAPKYPLFMKNKPSRYWLTEKQKIAIGILAVLTVLCWAVFPMSFYERTCLHTDGSLTYYNAVNQAEKHWETQNIHAVKFDICLTGGKSANWVIELTLETEDETEFYFRGGEFAGSWEETLGNMLRIKEHFSRSVSIDGVEYLDHLIEDYSFTDAELELLYQLFDVSNEP